MNYVTRYLPTASLNNKQLVTLAEVLGDEFKRFDKKMQQEVINNFIYGEFEDDEKTPYLDDNGILQWEKIFQIPLSCREDKFRIETIRFRRSFKAPFTMLSFAHYLQTMWERGDYVLELDLESKTLFIDVKTFDTETYTQYQKFLRYVVPANIKLQFSIPYMYIYLQRFYKYGISENIVVGNLKPLSELTYEELSQFSNKDI
jgi:hypothetical protein